MHGDAKVIERLNSALCDELTAIVEYMTQSEMCQSWGYQRLGEVTKARAIQEMHHAEALIERLLFLDSVPAVTTPLNPQFGSKVQEQLEIAFRDEQKAIQDYNHAIRVCVEAKDEGSKAIFDRLLHDEEQHADFLEAQLHSIKEIGIANYLAQQVRGN